jgi:hypothetical protein
VIPRGRENLVAINLIIQHIKKQLEIRHIKTDFTDFMKTIDSHVPKDLHILPHNNQGNKSR